MAVKGETFHSDACKGEAHYWIIDDKNFGICKKCGAQKQFPVDVFGWQNRNLVIGKAPHRPTLEELHMKVILEPIYRTARTKHERE